MYVHHFITRFELVEVLLLTPCNEMGVW